MILMEQKKYDDISISEITAKAGVSRMTYYRTYVSKEDIFKQYFLEYIDEHFPKNSQESPVFINEWLEAIVKAIQTHPNLITALKENPKLKDMAYKFFLENTQKILKEQYDMDTENPEIHYQISFTAGALAAVFDCWNERGQQESLPDLIHIIDKCIHFQYLQQQPIIQNQKLKGTSHVE
jgi:AcrR family transcriptional regulator